MFCTCNEKGMFFQETCPFNLCKTELFFNQVVFFDIPVIDFTSFRSSLLLVCYMISALIHPWFSAITLFSETKKILMFVIFWMAFFSKPSLFALKSLCFFFFFYVFAILFVYIQLHAIICVPRRHVTENRYENKYHMCG